MANIGTKAGTIIPPTQALKIAGDPDEVASYANVSDYLGFGSFSGADIKVVVHYPHPDKAFLDMIKSNIAEDQRLFNESAAELDRIMASQEYANKTNTVAILQENLEQYSTSLTNMEEELEQLSKIPTSKVLAELQTISWQIHRDKAPVRTLGSVYPRAYTRGPRTIAGSMIFTVFHQHVLHEILALNLKFYNTGTSDHDKYTYTTNLPDQLPPLDISLVFANEYGALSHMGIWGVEFVSEGSTFSIEDIFSENVVQYVARDLDPMRIVDKRAIDGQGIKEEWTMTADKLSRHKNFLNNHIYRRNQFI